jgi:hypothetical protein
MGQALKFGFGIWFGFGVWAEFQVGRLLGGRLGFGFGFCGG